jgi:hypothetical protein
MKRLFVALCLLLLVSFCFAEELTFDEEDVSSWYGDIDKFRDLRIDKRNKAWGDSSVSAAVKDLSAGALATKIRTQKKVGDDSVGSISVSGVDVLTWNADGFLTDGKKNGIRIDLENVPSTVSKISYDDETGIATYTYKDGGKVSIKKGMIDENSYLIDDLLNAGVGEGKRKIKLDLGIEGEGEIEIDEEGKFKIKNGAIVEVGDRKFLSALENEGDLVIGDNRFEIKNLGVDVEKFHVLVLPIEGDKPFHLVFEKPKDGEYDKTENGAWIYDSPDPEASAEKLNVKMKGKNVVMDFKESWLKGGDKPKDLRVEGDGEGLIFGVGGIDLGINKGQTFIPRNANDLEAFGGSLDLVNVNQKPGEDGDVPVYHFGTLEGFVPMKIEVVEEPPVVIVSEVIESPKPAIEVPTPDPVAGPMGSKTRICIGTCTQLVEGPVGTMSGTETAKTRGFGNKEQIKEMPSGLKGSAILKEFSSKKYDKELEIDLTLKIIPAAGRMTDEGAQAIRGYVKRGKFLADIKKEAEVLPKADRIKFVRMVDGLSSKLSDYKQNHAWTEPGTFYGTNKEKDTDVIFKNTKLNIVVPGEDRGNPYAVFTLTKLRSGSKLGIDKGTVFNVYGVVKSTQLYETVRVDIDSGYHGILRKLTSTGVTNPDKYDKSKTSREWRGVIEQYEKTH